MIFLLNIERVFRECLLGLKAVIAAELGVPEEWVSVQLTRRDDSFVPEVSITPPTIEGASAALMAVLAEATRFASLTPDEIRALIGRHVATAMQEIKAGLAGLDT